VYTSGRVNMPEQIPKEIDCPIVEQYNSRMDIQELTEAMHEFVSAQGWYNPDSPRPQALRNLAISLSLEANEVLEHFQWSDHLDDSEALSGELADVTLYLLQIASLAGVDLEKAVLVKLEKNYTRKWDQTRE
jgi:NTP pyrophosphatase (non-canonical NTP hydrolase)